MTRQLIFEQFNSLMNGLAGAGLENGNVAELTLRHVGIRQSLYGQPSLAFCPSMPYDLRILRLGHKDQRRLPFGTVLRLGDTLCQSVLADAPENGFLDLTVCAGSVIELSGKIVRVEETSLRFPVHASDSYRNWHELTTA